MPFGLWLDSLRLLNIVPADALFNRTYRQKSRSWCCIKYNSKYCHYYILADVFGVISGDAYEIYHWIHHFVQYQSIFRCIIKPCTHATCVSVVILVILMCYTIYFVAFWKYWKFLLNLMLWPDIYRFLFIVKNVVKCVQKHGTNICSKILLT
jgi:hypothetical protein